MPLELPSLDSDLGDRAVNIIYRSTLRAWVNYRLLKRNMKINSIKDDLRDGVALVLLVDVLTGQRISIPYRSSGVSARPTPHLSLCIILHTCTHTLEHANEYNAA